MKDTDEKLTRKQEVALIALLEKGTVKDAAKKSGVSETTLWRWLQLPVFQQHYRAARASLIETAVARLESASDVAITTLCAVCEDTSAPATARIAAARAILSGAFRGGDLIKAVEERQKHKHLCAGCKQIFECLGADCAEFEFSQCQKCRGNSQKATG